MIDVIDRHALRGAGDDAVHEDVFVVYSGYGVACCGCVFGEPFVFDEFVVVASVYECEWAALDWYEACAVIAAGQEGGRVCAIEIAAAAKGSGGAAGFAVGRRVNADENSPRQADDWIGESAELTSPPPQFPPHPPSIFGPGAPEFN